MATVTIEEAQARLRALIEQMHPGEEIIITRDLKPIARLIAEQTPQLPARQLGTIKGSVLYMAPDFHAPLEEFKEYPGQQHAEKSLCVHHSGGGTILIL
jgi:antitoxin (DNA-binding transcriptional repressor) of toxin-antitoxin stability system